MAKCNLEQLMEAVVTELGASASPHGFGRKDLKKRKTPPYVVWIEADADYEGADRAGADVTGKKPRLLWLEKKLVEIHLWATTKANLEILRNNEIVALHHLTSTSMVPRKNMPVAESEEWHRLGEAAVLTVTIDFTVRDEVVPTDTLEGWEYESDSIPGDGWIEHGEP